LKTTILNIQELFKKFRTGGLIIEFMKGNLRMNLFTEESYLGLREQWI
jgi:hypothetical protein